MKRSSHIGLHRPMEQRKMLKLNNEFVKTQKISMSLITEKSHVILI